jgi:endoplasmic reticulum chaperone BiP
LFVVCLLFVCCGLLWFVSCGLFVVVCCVVCLSLFVCCCSLLWSESEDKVISKVIGIDLATTYSCVGIFQKGKVDIIANDQSNCVTPSNVAFTENERLIGEGAKNQAALNPPNWICIVTVSIP